MSIKNLDDINHLYKNRYFDCNNYHIKTILDNEFYFASKEELNDPFDLSLRPSYELGTKDEMIQHYIQEVDRMNISASEKIIYKATATKKIENDPEFIKKSLIKGYDDQIKNYRICSFSANKWNNILMWAHYSNANTGFCVGLNWKKLLMR